MPDSRWQSIKHCSDNQPRKVNGIKFEQLWFDRDTQCKWITQFTLTVRSQNHIQEVKADAFTNCKMFSILSLAENNELQSIDNNAFYTTTDYKLEESTDTSSPRPIYMACVDVDDCPNLTWSIPDTWNHIPTIDVTNKEGLKFGDSHVIVYHKIPME